MRAMGEHHQHEGKHAVHLALVARLRAQAAEIARLTSGLEETALARRTVPDKWSLKELVCHFRRMEAVFADRFKQMLTEDAIIVPYDDPDHDPVFIALTKRPTAEVLSEFFAERDALCRRLESLTPAEWHRTARHPQFAYYDLHFGVEYMVHHEAHHIYQLFQRRVPFGKMPH
jgi:DinB superfamily